MPNSCADSEGLNNEINITDNAVPIIAKTEYIQTEPLSGHKNDVNEDEVVRLG